MKFSNDLIINHRVAKNIKTCINKYCCFAVYNENETLQRDEMGKIQRIPRGHFIKVCFTMLLMVACDTLATVK